MPAIPVEGARTRGAALAAAALGLAAILVYSVQFLSEPARAAAVLSFALMSAGASLLAGGLLGFLFGIPRALQQEPEAGKVGYRANTNLEQISDWLTKILVGVGLTQIPAIRDHGASLVAYVGQGLGGNAAAGGAFAFALLLYFSTAGFLAVYLWTRLFLAPEFASADLKALAARVEKAEQASRDVLDSVQKQAEADARALILVQRQLEPVEGMPPPTQAELDKAIAEASPAVRVQAFNQARELRRTTWRTDKSKMERAIPVLRALCASDTKREYHRSHGQLAYALKDQRQPDWKAAEAQLNAAIEIRGASKGWTLYEFCRAMCRIQQDEAFAQGRPSAAGQKERIAADLRIAARNAGSALAFKDEPVVRQWMALNGIAREELTEEARAAVPA